MSQLLAIKTQRTKIWSLLIIVAVIAAAALFGIEGSRNMLLLLLGGLGAVLLLKSPRLGLLIIIFAALLIRVGINTGTQVRLNAATLLLPVFIAFWLLDMVRRKEIHLVSSHTFFPLFLFLLAGAASLIIGNATWDPFVPRSPNFLLVQLAQLGIFVLSAAAYFLVANLVKDERWLRYLVWLLLAIGGGLALLYMLPGARGFVNRTTTVAFSRAPFWMLITAVAGGQLLFNRTLPLWQRIFLLLTLGAVGYYALVLQREGISVWIGVLAVSGMLLWLRWPRMIWLLVPVFLILLVVGGLFSQLYEFAGGDAEWALSGISRIDLGRRVVQVTMRNPITGLGPASYRPYANATPLYWSGGTGVWTGAVVSSHNNYIDLFAHVGVVGLAIFLWFMAAVTLLGFRLRKRFSEGFSSGYVNGALSAVAGAMVLMVFADWFLPFVYNIGFEGFQASLLIWLYLGGLVALENFKDG